MKVFVVDIKKCLELSHYETFFYENIKEDNLCLCDHSLSSIKELDSVYDWIQGEINRSPFSITKGLVVFFIPRNLTVENTSYLDLDLIVKTYIHRKIARKLDARFRYVCFFLDRTGYDRVNEKTYQLLTQDSENFCAARPEFNIGEFPRDMENEQLGFDEIRSRISDIRDETMREYYTEVLDKLIEANEGIGDTSSFTTAFLNDCHSNLTDVNSIKVPHFGNDIAEKTRGLLKIVSYVCDTAKEGNDEQFDQMIHSFVNEANFEEAEPDYDGIKKVIATYRMRLNRWLADHPTYEHDDGKDISRIEYIPSDFAAEYNAEIDELAINMAMKDVMNPSLNDLISFELTDTIFRRLDATLTEASEKLRKFSDEVIAYMHRFCERNKDFVTEPAIDPIYTEEEIKEAAKAEGRLNHYIVNDLPGYPAELRLRQELDAINEKIRAIGERIRQYTVKLFAGTFLFAFLSVFVIYLTSQYSVFMKENTWWVFGVFNLVTAALFILGYFGIKRKYMKQAKALLNEALEKVKEFLKNYKSRAKEFEDNVNNAMLYSCLCEQQNRLTLHRSEEKDLTERYQWHKLKMNAILTNLKFFASFVGNTSPEDEKSIPALEPFEEDAANSEFYQMKIFS